MNEEVSIQFKELDRFTKHIFQEALELFHLVLKHMDAADVFDDSDFLTYYQRAVHNTDPFLRGEERVRAIANELQKLIEEKKRSQTAQTTASSETDSEIKSTGDRMLDVVQKNAADMPMLAGATGVFTDSMLRKDNWQINDKTKQPYYYPSQTDNSVRMAILIGRQDKEGFIPLAPQVMAEILEKAGVREAYLCTLFATLAYPYENPWEKFINFNGLSLVKMLGFDKVKTGGYRRMTSDERIQAVVDTVERLGNFGIRLEEPTDTNSKIKIPEHMNPNTSVLWETYARKRREQTTLFPDGKDGAEVQIPYDTLEVKFRAGEYASVLNNTNGFQHNEAFAMFAMCPAVLFELVQENCFDWASRWALIITSKQPVARSEYTVKTLLKYASSVDKDIPNLLMIDRWQQDRIFKHFSSEIRYLNKKGFIVDDSQIPETLRPIHVPNEMPKRRKKGWCKAWLNSKLTITSPAFKPFKQLVFERQRDIKRGLLTINKHVTSDMIVKRRKEMGMSGEDLANKLGKSKAFISRIETGRIRIKSDIEFKLWEILFKAAAKTAALNSSTAQKSETLTQPDYD